jgi:hypothetical protein
MPQRARYTRVDLHERAKELHKPRVQVWNIGWLCVASALALSMFGIVAISTTTRHSCCLADRASRHRRDRCCRDRFAALPLDPAHPAIRC